MLCVTQEWDVSIDYGGWRSDSDYVDGATCVMCKDEEGYYVNLDYVRQCVPFLEKELQKSAEWCMESYGEVPNHKESAMRRVATLENKIIDMVWNLIDSHHTDDTMLEIDTLEHTVYPVPLEGEHEGYGGIIRFIPTADLLKTASDGSLETDLDKIKQLAAEIDKAEW